MKKLYCDICRAPLDEDGNDNIVYSLNHKFGKIDLCDKCSKEAEKMLSEMLNYEKEWQQI